MQLFLPAAMMGIAGMICNSYPLLGVILGFIAGVVWSVANGH